MKSSVLRKEILEYLAQADERFLVLVHSMIQAEKRSSSQSDNLLKQKMTTSAESSEEDITEKQVIRGDDFNADFEQWKKEKRQSSK